MDVISEEDSYSIFTKYFKDNYDDFKGNNFFTILSNLIHHYHRRSIYKGIPLLQILCILIVRSYVILMHDGMDNNSETFLVNHYFINYLSEHTFSHLIQEGGGDRMEFMFLKEYGMVRKDIFVDFLYQLLNMSKHMAEDEHVLKWEKQSMNEDGSVVPNQRNILSKSSMKSQSTVPHHEWIPQGEGDDRVWVPSPDTKHIFEEKINDAIYSADGNIMMSDFDPSLIGPFSQHANPLSVVSGPDHSGIGVRDTSKIHVLKDYFVSSINLNRMEPDFKSSGLDRLISRIIDNNLFKFVLVYLEQLILKIDQGNYGKLTIPHVIFKDVIQRTEYFRLRHNLDYKINKGGPTDDISTIPVPLLSNLEKESINILDMTKKLIAKKLDNGNHNVDMGSIVYNDDIKNYDSYYSFQEESYSLRDIWTNNKNITPFFTDTMMNDIALGEVHFLLLVSQDIFNEMETIEKDIDLCISTITSEYSLVIDNSMEGSFYPNNWHIEKLFDLIQKLLVYSMASFIITDDIYIGNEYSHHYRDHLKPYLQQDESLNILERDDWLLNREYIYQNLKVIELKFYNKLLIELFSTSSFNIAYKESKEKNKIIPNIFIDVFAHAEIIRMQLHPTKESPPLIIIPHLHGGDTIDDDGYEMVPHEWDILKSRKRIENTVLNHIRKLIEYNKQIYFILVQNGNYTNDPFINNEGVFIKRDDVIRNPEKYLTIVRGHSPKLILNRDNQVSIINNLLRSAYIRITGGNIEVIQRLRMPPNEKWGSGVDTTDGHPVNNIYQYREVTLAMESRDTSKVQYPFTDYDPDSPKGHEIMDEEEDTIADIKIMDYWVERSVYRNSINKNEQAYEVKNLKDFSMEERPFTVDGKVDQAITGLHMPFIIPPNIETMDTIQFKRVSKWLVPDEHGTPWLDKKRSIIRGIHSSLIEQRRTGDDEELVSLQYLPEYRKINEGKVIDDKDLHKLLNSLKQDIQKGETKYVLPIRDDKEILHIILNELKRKYDHDYLTMVKTVPLAVQRSKIINKIKQYKQEIKQNRSATYDNNRKRAEINQLEQQLKGLSGPLKKVPDRGGVRPFGIIKNVSKVYKHTQDGLDIIRENLNKSNLDAVRIYAKKINPKIVHDSRRDLMESASGRWDIDDNDLKGRIIHNTLQTIKEEELDNSDIIERGHIKKELNDHNEVMHKIDNFDNFELIEKTKLILKYHSIIPNDHHSPVELIILVSILEKHQFESEVHTIDLIEGLDNVPFLKEAILYLDKIINTILGSTNRSVDPAVDPAVGLPIAQQYLKNALDLINRINNPSGSGINNEDIKELCSNTIDVIVSEDNSFWNIRTLKLTTIKPLKERLKETITLLMEHHREHFDINEVFDISPKEYKVYETDPDGKTIINTRKENYIENPTVAFKNVTDHTDSERFEATNLYDIEEKNLEGGGGKNHRKGLTNKYYKLPQQKNKNKTERKKSKRKMKKKRTVRKSKEELGSGVYLDFKNGSSRKFWRIVKNGTKLTTHYGRLGSLGQMTTKDYGSKVEQQYDKLIQSKKKKGYVEKIDFGDPNPKKPTNVEREYINVCRKAEKSKVLNPQNKSLDCEGMLDQGESELKWMTQWHKDALTKGEYNWNKYNEHYKSKRKKSKRKK